jgi:hypothetical protein
VAIDRGSSDVGVRAGEMHVLSEALSHISSSSEALHPSHLPVPCITDVAPPMSSIVVCAAPCDPGQAPLPSTPLQRSSATPQIVDAPQVALACVPGSSPPSGAAQHLVDDSVIPKYPPHVLALRELPASAAQRAIPLLEAVIKRRRAHVHQVLRNHAVPDELCDSYNLTCGLRGVTFVVETNGDAAGRGFWRYELKLFNVSTKPTRVEASSLALLLSKVDAFSALNSPESLVSAMAVTSIRASAETEPPAALELTSSTPQAAPPPECAVPAGMPVTFAVSVEAAGTSSALLSTMPVVVAVPWPAPSEHVQPAAPMGRTSSANGECRACQGAHRAHTCRDRGLGALPAPERLPSLKAYLLCCSCAAAARGAAAALGVPPLADVCWMDDDELVNELHGLLSHEVLFVYVRWMVCGRLVQVTPPSASLESLMSRAQASAYRLPLLAFAAACSDLWRDRKSVQGTDRPVWPVQLKARDDCGPGRISAVTLANYFSQLRGWARGEMAAVVVDNRVVEALSFARRELRLAPIASTPPLVHGIVRAAFEQLTAKHDWELRLALWLVLAVALKVRTHEGCTLMHDDLVIAPGDVLGWWQVPTFTKTSDGLEGKVARYVRKPTCRHRTLTAIQALALTELDLLGCALGIGGTDERLQYDDVCLCCLHRLVWRRQSKCHGCVDALTFVFQEVEGDHAERKDGMPSTGRYKGRIVTPEALLFSLRFVLFEVVRSREASGLPALVGLDSAEAADAYVLYSARKGGFINDLCSDGYPAGMACPPSGVHWARLLGHVPLFRGGLGGALGVPAWRRGCHRHRGRHANGVGGSAHRHGRARARSHGCRTSTGDYGGAQADGCPPRAGHGDLERHLCTRGACDARRGRRLRAHGE